MAWHLEQAIRGSRLPSLQGLKLHVLTRDPLIACIIFATKFTVYLACCEPKERERAVTKEVLGQGQTWGNFEISGHQTKAGEEIQEQICIPTETKAEKHIASTKGGNNLTCKRSDYTH